MAKRIKFPPLAPGSKVRIEKINNIPAFIFKHDLHGDMIFLESGSDLVLLCALAAAEWEDVADFMTSGLKSVPENWNQRMWKAKDNAENWHDFRREHCK